MIGYTTLQHEVRTVLSTTTFPHRHKLTQLLILQTIYSCPKFPAPMPPGQPRNTSHDPQCAVFGAKTRIDIAPGPFSAVPIGFFSHRALFASQKQFPIAPPQIESPNSDNGLAELQGLDEAIAAINHQAAGSQFREELTKLSRYHVFDLPTVSANGSNGKPQHLGSQALLLIVRCVIPPPLLFFCLTDFGSIRIESLLTWKEQPEWRRSRSSTNKLASPRQSTSNPKCLVGLIAR